jgi:signal transduction histidine kinase/CheY-like chemotaxis protein
MSISRKRNNSNVSELKHQNEELQKKIEELSDIIEQERKNTALSSKIFSFLSAGHLYYNFTTEDFYVSQNLKQLFENCITQDLNTPLGLIENIHSEDRLFIQDIFTAPLKSQQKKIFGQFRLSQRTKDYKEIKYFGLTGIYETNDADELTLLCSIREISKEVKQLRDLQRNIEKAEDSDRIKTIFLLNISHNIRTPMNSILGFAELLSMTDPGPEKRKEFIQVIKKQSKNLLLLIDDVAEIAKYESGTMTVTKTPVNLNLLIKEIAKDVENLRSAVRKDKVKIIQTLPSREGIEIYTDAGRLHQIFLNLINHSLRYTTQGSIKLGYNLPSENKIDFFVQDTSRGISKDDLKNLLDRSTQLDKSEYSRYDDETGLGLNIAKSILKLLGGKISFDSDAEKGTIFNFSLPYESTPEQIKSIEDELAFNGQYKWANKVILIVEDEEVNGLFLEAIFQETGAQTLYAKNGFQAVELCRSISKIDLILMDIRMPVMNGLKATQEIRKFNPSVPIIAQTALALEEDRQNCLLAGCNDSIIKPIEVEELLNLVNKYFIH